MTEVAAGWYEDPQVQGQQRYWDGSAWTEHVQPLLLFDGMLNLVKAIGKEERRLVVTHTEMWWGDEYVRWDDVIGFNQQTTTMQGLNYFHEIFLQLNDRDMHMKFMARPNKGRGDQAYALLIEILKQTLGVRVLTGLMQMLDNGEPVRVSGLLFSPDGFCHEENDQPLIPWNEFAEYRFTGQEGIFINLYRVNESGKPKRVVTQRIDMLRSWVIPPIVEEHARRYGAPM